MAERNDESKKDSWRNLPKEDQTATPFTFPTVLNHTKTNTKRKMWDSHQNFTSSCTTRTRFPASPSTST